MRVGRNYLVISLIVGIIFLGFSSANNAYATDIVLNSVSWPTLPGGAQLGLFQHQHVQNPVALTW